MELIKKNILLILIIFFLAVLVVLRSSGTRHFRYDAKRWAEPSYTGSNIITTDRISLLKGNLLIIALGNEQPSFSVPARIISVPPDSILAKRYSGVISSNKGPVILFSSDYSVSSRIWMILCQSGFRNIYICSPDSGNEVLKKEFRPDSITRPE